MVNERVGPSKLPLALLTLAAAMAVRRLSRPRPYDASNLVSPWMRTAGRWPPDSDTRPTPLTWLIFSARRVLTMFCTCVSGIVSEVIAKVSTGASAGLILAYTGGAGKSVGSSEPPALMAACTSCSATSRVWPKVNCRVMMETPAALVELMRCKPDICPNWRSSGAVTVCPITSGLAPGYSVCTWMVGKSTCGKAASGRNLKPTRPASTMASISSAVATGRLMNGVDGLIAPRPSLAPWLAQRWPTLRPVRWPRRQRAGGGGGVRHCLPPRHRRPWPACRPPG
ncbi:hypothetical protein D3C81_321910 [compost metagenome]